MLHQACAGAGAHQRACASKCIFAGPAAHACLTQFDAVSVHSASGAGLVDQLQARQGESWTLFPWHVLLGPRAARLEQHVPLPKLPGCVLSDWHLDIFSETDDAAIDPQPDMVLTKGGNFSSCDGRSLRWCIKVTSVWLISPYLVGLAFSRSFL